MGSVARMVCAAPGAIVTVGVVLAVISAIIVCLRFNVVNNTSDLLSDKVASKQYYNELKKDFGSDYRFIVLIQSPDAAQNRKAADEVGAYLETLKPQLTTVISKIDFSSVKPRVLFTQSPDKLEKIAKQLQSQVDAQKAQQEQNKKTEQMALDLNSILTQVITEFNDSDALHKKDNWVKMEPSIKQFIDILNRVSAQAENKTVKQVAPADNSSDSDDDNEVDANEMFAQHEYFTLQDGKSVLVFAYTGEQEKDSASPFSNTSAKIREQLKKIEGEYPNSTIELTGEPALDTDQAEEANSDAAMAGGITMALIIALFLFSYRTVLRPAFAILVLVMAVLWSLAFALITVGHFNILSVAVIPMVLGIGIDFGIQILGRYEEELGHGRTIKEAVAAALQHTGVAIITGGSTTACAFFTLCFNDFVGLAELGVIAGASMVFCIVANLVLLPAVFVLRDRRLTPEQLKSNISSTAWRFIQTWDRDMVRTPWLWIGLSVIISIAAALSLPKLRFDYNLLHLNNPKAPSQVALYKVMDASKNDQGNEISTIYASIVANNLDDARDLSKKLLALPVVAKVESILELVPEGQDKKMPIIKRIVDLAAQLNVKPATNKPVDIPKAKRDIKNLLQQSRDGLKQASAFSGMAVAKLAIKTFNEMIPALERADKALNSAPVDEIQKRFSASSAGAFTNLQANMELLRTQKADRGLTLADIPPQLQKLFVSSTGNGKILLQVYGKKDLWERAPDEEFTLAILKVADHATGTPVLNYYATELLRISYLKAAGWAFLAITVLIFLHFQSFKYLVLTLTPLVLAVLWRTGAMVWFNIEFNPANIVTLPLIIGIDVAFGVYIIDRFREDGRLSIFAGSTGKAIIMSALTSLFGFSSLLISRFPGMWDIGQLMSLGIAIGLVTAIFMLPQILSLLKPPAPEGQISPKPKA